MDVEDNIEKEVKLSQKDVENHLIVKKWNGWDFYSFGLPLGKSKRLLFV